MQIYAGWSDIQQYISNLPIGGKILFISIITLLITVSTCLGMYLHRRRIEKIESLEKNLE